MYHKILHEPLRFPKGERLQLSEPSKDLLRCMLERKVSDRLGCGVGGASDIKRAAFFATQEFNKVRLGPGALACLELPPPPLYWLTSRHEHTLTASLQVRLLLGLPGSHLLLSRPGISTHTPSSPLRYAL